MLSCHKKNIDSATLAYKVRLILKKILFTLIASFLPLSTYALTSGTIDLSGTVEQVIELEVQNPNLMNMLKGMETVSNSDGEEGEEGEEENNEPVFHEFARMSISSNSSYNIAVGGL
ncbi:MAG: hypothetical protein ACI9S8_003209 [Chlamydiales bacterium]|jgi:hypothetical protein